MKRKQKTLEEKIYTFLGKVFAMILFTIPFVLLMTYGFMHATTLN